MNRVNKCRIICKYNLVLKRVTVRLFEVERRRLQDSMSKNENCRQDTPFIGRVGFLNLEVSLKNISTGKVSAFKNYGNFKVRD